MSLADEKRDALLPQVDDLVMKQYTAERNSLLLEEAKRRSDALFREKLSPIARQACDIVDRIREEEKKTVWTPEVEETLAHQAENTTIYPGMMFSLSKKLMESTRLWKIVRRMPKGALLHAHLDAMVDFTFLIDVLLREPGIHISSDRPLSDAKAFEGAAILFRFRKVDQTPLCSIWSKDYEPGTLVLLARTAEMYPNGGRSGFIKWLYSRCTLSQTDAVAQHHGVDAIWQKFQSCFNVVDSMIHYEPIFRTFLRRLLRLLKTDGLNYAEVRFSWALDYYRKDCETPEQDYTTMMDTIEEEVKDFQNTEEGRGFWGIRIIWASLRFMPRQSILQNMQHCLATKLTHPHLIAGYDLVGQEDLGPPSESLLRELFWFRNQCNKSGLILPYFFHAGECLGSGSEADNNLYDVILLGTRRIGHGFSLYKHPLLIQMVKERNILIESCPISNEVLRLCGSVMSHPLPALLANGVPCSLCNDDPAMLGHDTAGTTHEFWQALQGWENLGLAGLGSLAENSVRWSAFEDQTDDEWQNGVSNIAVGGLKGLRLREWASDWERFCEWVVEDYGES
ncbi:adenosine/AMP deaminase [Astrocystis sublimbata]|nr:adenosine/AMP deaminase [Astrocystis sublimbata]